MRRWKTRSLAKRQRTADNSKAFPDSSCQWFICLMSRRSGSTSPLLVLSASLSGEEFGLPAPVNQAVPLFPWPAVPKGLPHSHTQRGGKWDGQANSADSVRLFFYLGFPLGRTFPLPDPPSLPTREREKVVPDLFHVSPGRPPTPPAPPEMFHILLVPQGSFIPNIDFQFSPFFVSSFNDRWHLH